MINQILINWSIAFRLYDKKFLHFATSRTTTNKFMTTFLWYQNTHNVEILSKNSFSKVIPKKPFFQMFNLQHGWLIFMNMSIGFITRPGKIWFLSYGTETSRPIRKQNYLNFNFCMWLGVHRSYYKFIHFKWVWWGMLKVVENNELAISQKWP